jgi:hypothetical protein
MSDLLFAELLKREMSAAPPLDPAEQDRLATEAQAKLPPWKRKVGGVAEGGMEALLGALGLRGDATEPTSIPNALGNAVGMALMPLKSMVRVPAFRAAQHKALIDAAPTAATKQALIDLTKRYPRLSAHFQKVDPVPARSSTRTVGGMEAKVATSPLGGGVPEARGDLTLNARLTSPMDSTQTIAHETQHLADFVRTADRARHAGIDDDPAKLFNELYKKATKRAGDDYETAGYFENPFEVRARTTQEASTMDRRVPGQLREAALKARDPMQAEMVANRALGNWDDVAKVLERQALSPIHMRVIEEPPTLSVLLKRLDRRFRGGR